ncbi:peptidoglycan bridge formation glycyltransferase FemA/FemB family protein [Muriicola marianensis]|uniref:GNAT family N-acetyltransferase n=1 Tax=Muriicola marianensis TaxID=1324801 RepID=A0ABQ1QT66_9FLAO|nr:peptidoglycan bridge formation glycyltransferase FemA/FemB family protein [Muriicola marianensis]GGD41100.1 hypothetical protein GCM10011361_05240 [Muriicola marianensis]
METLEETYSVRCIQDKPGWKEALKEFSWYDCYHTYDFNHSSKRSDEIPVLFSFCHNDACIAIPFLKRPIPGSRYNDITSVWGYGGPISKNLNELSIPLFKEALHEFFIEQKVVSVFSRLNPYLNNQEELLADLGIIEDIGPVVNIDLTLPLDLQRQVFSKTTKRYINKGRRLCHVRRSKEGKDILKFINLYYENMDRVDAKDSYYFNKDYVFDLLFSKDFETDLYIAELKESGEMISGAMMIKTNNIIQYHMSGTADKYLHLTPIRLLLDETRLDGTEAGYTYFNLGGGLGGRDDSLLHFKSSFSKDHKMFKVWKYIVNREEYDRLCLKNKGRTFKISETDYFPAYRDKD